MFPLSVVKLNSRTRHGFLYLSFKIVLLTRYVYGLLLAACIYIIAPLAAFISHLYALLILGSFKYTVSAFSFFLTVSKHPVANPCFLSSFSREVRGLLLAICIYIVAAPLATFFVSLHILRGLDSPPTRQIYSLAPYFKKSRTGFYVCVCLFLQKRLFNGDICLFSRFQCGQTSLRRSGVLFFVHILWALN